MNRRNRCDCAACLRRQALKAGYVTILLAMAALLVALGYTWPR